MKSYRIRHIQEKTHTHSQMLYKHMKKKKPNEMENIVLDEKFRF